jgi:hypothetical protein
MANELASDDRNWSGYSLRVFKAYPFQEDIDGLSWRPQNYYIASRTESTPSGA